MSDGRWNKSAIWVIYDRKYFMLGILPEWMTDVWIYSCVMAILNSLFKKWQIYIAAQIFSLCVVVVLDGYEMSVPWILFCG